MKALFEIDSPLKDLCFVDEYLTRVIFTFPNSDPEMSHSVLFPSFRSTAFYQMFMKNKCGLKGSKAALLSSVFKDIIRNVSSIKMSKNISTFVEHFCLSQVRQILIVNGGRLTTTFHCDPARLCNSIKLRLYFIVRVTPSGRN